MYEVLTVRVAGLTNPGAELTVNGIDVHVGADWRFSLNLSLNKGVNTITLIATTPYDEEVITASVELIAPEGGDTSEEDLSPLMITLGVSGWVVAAVAIILLLCLKKEEGLISIYITGRWYYSDSCAPVRFSKIC